MPALASLDSRPGRSHGSTRPRSDASRPGRASTCPGATTNVTDLPPPSQSSILSASRGEPAAIEDVLRAYLPRLQRFVHLRLGPQLRAREDTLDIVQSTARELLQQSQFEWRGEVEFRAWLFQAALNKIREKGRYHAAEKRAADREVGGLPPDDLGDAIRDLATPSKIAIANEQRQRLEAAFAHLTEPQREVLTMARIVGLPHAVIAERLGKSEVAVRQLLVRAMAALGDALGDADSTT